jgi:polyphosphate kinase
METLKPISAGAEDLPGLEPQVPGQLPAAQRYLNRELSWLAFNYRVLQEAQNTANPLLERVRYLAISDTNLDEFTAVRVSQLKGKLEDGNTDYLTPDGLNLHQQLAVIYEEMEDLFQVQQQTWQTLRQTLAEHGIKIVQVSDLTPDDLDWLQNYFVREVLPVLTPLACDPAHPFPFIPNDGLCMALKLKDGKALWSLLPLPPSLPRFIRLGNQPRRQLHRSASYEGRANEAHFLLLEEAIPLFFDKIFPNFKIKRYGLFHLLRDSDTAMEVESGQAHVNLAEHYLRAVKGRKWGCVVRLTFGSGVPEEMREFVTKQLSVDEEDVFEVHDGLINLSDVAQLTSEDRPDLKFPHYEVRFPERVKDWRGDYFAAITNKEFVVHHPYESFDVVVEFLRQAARDPDVVVIKQTLYRTSRTSTIVRALVEAAEAGKSVTVVVELKARFDEEANIRLANDLERAGAHIVYGFVDKKTHAKMTLVMRREQRGLRGYVHLGTGNYHPVTAKTYTDVSFFTGDEAIVRDVGKVFNYLTGYATPDRLEKLAIAPINLKSTVLELIEEEIAHAREGRPAHVWAKMNSLVDPVICDALYTASQAGVQVDLIVRGICCLRPGVPGMSDNIRVKSIVGRFLEHSRILCVGNGHRLPHKRAKVFICSADWMPRNFHTRVETLVPLHTDSVHAQVLEQVMMANLKDTRNSWYLGPDGAYRRHSGRPDFSAHEYFMHNPSLSGRGKSRKGNQVEQLTLEGETPPQV